jgi:hypothetical protein
MGLLFQIKRMNPVFRRPATLEPHEPQSIQDFITDENSKARQQESLGMNATDCPGEAG